MARIAGIDLQDSFRIDYALTKIKGIGWTLSRRILKNVDVDAGKRLSQLGSDELTKISAELEKYLTEGELARVIRANIARLKQVGTYRGLRHAKGLPVRGQRTRRNARTKRGKRKTVGAFKKEMLSKMQQTKKEE